MKWKRLRLSVGHAALPHGVHAEPHWWSTSSPLRWRCPPRETWGARRSLEFCLLSDFNHHFRRSNLEKKNSVITLEIVKWGHLNQPEQAAEAFHHDPHLPPLPGRRHGVLHRHRRRHGDANASQGFLQQASALPPTGGPEVRKSPIRNCF